MLSQVASKFPMIWLTCLGLLIFLGVFLGVLAWVYRRGSTELYQQIADAPFAGDSTKGAPLR
jgi:cbb3-type cytochrome oxidase subunit 3